MAQPVMAATRPRASSAALEAQSAEQPHANWFRGTTDRHTLRVLKYYIKDTLPIYQPANQPSYTSLPCPSLPAVADVLMLHLCNQQLYARENRIPGPSPIEMYRCPISREKTPAYLPKAGQLRLSAAAVHWSIKLARICYTLVWSDLYLRNSLLIEQEQGISAEVSFEGLPRRPSHREKRCIERQNKVHSEEEGEEDEEKQDKDEEQKEEEDASGRGAIFEQGTDEVQSAFKFAMLNHNQNTTTRKFELQAFVDVINTADAYKLSRLRHLGVNHIFVVRGNLHDIVE
ncbi:Glutamate receptor 1 [Harpegnathos saltator]|uniref:Glutamate receptor 1 n=1 Tax=Harpegnathos saltator TaxID=610380 RepID=E2BF29_HARSA|nr:Glutamate receptor 1 [Harpegnathos saltator]